MGLKIGIKQKIMLRSMKKQKKAGFAAEDAERFALPVDAADNFNNSYYLTAHDGETSLYLRLGERGDGTCEVWASVKHKKEHFVNKRNLYPSCESPLKVECKETEKVWLHIYQGELFEVSYNGKETVTCGDGKNAVINLTFNATAPIYDFFTHGNDKLVARTYARQKWNKDFFEGLKKNKQTHYEQYGTVSGTVNIDGNEIKLNNLPAVRDHSYGMRDWGYMNRHFWLAGVSESGRAFNVSMVSYPNAAGIHAGNVFVDGKIINLEDFSIKDDTVCDGLGPDELTATLKTVDGNKLSLKGKRICETVYNLQNGAYTLREGYGEFVLDGETFRGVWEFGYNADIKKWSCYEDLSVI